MIRNKREVGAEKLNRKRISNFSLFTISHFLLTMKSLFAAQSLSMFVPIYYHNVLLIEFCFKL